MLCPQMSPDVPGCVPVPLPVEVEVVGGWWQVGWTDRGSPQPHNSKMWTEERRGERSEDRAAQLSNSLIPRNRKYYNNIILYFVNIISGFIIFD